MKVLQIINNNIIIAVDRRGTEIVIFGNGVGFKKKRGDKVNENAIQKKFIPDKKENQFNSSVEGIPFEILEISKDILDYGFKRYSLKIKDSAFFSLCDHLNLAIERFKNGINLNNPFIYDIKTYFIDEYRTALIAKDKIKNKFDVEVSDDEICYIAMHLVEGNDYSFTNQLNENLILVDEIMKIIKNELNIQDENNECYQYSRLLLHIKYFVGRYTSGKEVENNNDELFLILKKQFAKEFNCLMKVSEYLEENYGKKIKKSEIIYLLLHLKNCQGK